jgi:GNAT superfamily N-acetyltransferase
MSDIERLTEEYLRHVQHAEVLQKTINEYKRELNGLVEAEGDEDDKGHQWLTAGKYLLQRQRRQGKKILNIHRAEEWARDRGIWKAVSKTVEVLDEDALVGYIYDHRDEEGLEDEFQSLHDSPPVSYAFMKPVEEETYEY